MMTGEQEPREIKRLPSQCADADKPRSKRTWRGEVSDLRERAEQMRRNWVNMVARANKMEARELAMEEEYGL